MKDLRERYQVRYATGAVGRSFEWMAHACTWAASESAVLRAHVDVITPSSGPTECVASYFGGMMTTGPLPEPHVVRGGGA